MPTLPLILYEGVEDKAFLEALFEVHGIKNKFQFRPDCGGKDKFKSILQSIVIETGEQPKSIIIVADNDGEPAKMFKNIRRQTGKAGFTRPKKPRETVITNGLPPLSVLMIPWDKDEGCLETLCLSAANKKYKKQLACVDQLIKCVRAQKWDIAKKSKLRMRCLLSSVCKSNPNAGLQFAWSKRGSRPVDIFPIRGVPAFNQIAEYFKNILIMNELIDI